MQPVTARGRAGRTRAGATWDGKASISRCSPSTPKGSNCACSTPAADARSSAYVAERTDQVWHCYLPEARPGTLYGYRVHGPTSRNKAIASTRTSCCSTPTRKQHRRARALERCAFRLHASGTSARTCRSTAATARAACRSAGDRTAFTWGDDRRPNVPWHDTVIYEMHVRGFTRQHPEVPPQLRGTYAGFAARAVIDYLQRLGVTAVELMPVHAFVDDRRLVEQGLRNYWGYNTIGFFAPDMRYSRDPAQVDEFKTMVKALHAAGIEVILDVVYNHTAEGNQLGPTLCFRGIDNAAYYRLMPDDPRYYMDYTGCGNTLNMQHPRVLQLIMDSLRYWVTEMHVDGFRFDLAAALARETARGRPPAALLRHHASGSGAVAGQADRRAVGPGRRRLPGRQLSRRLGRMERPVSRHHARATGKATAGSSANFARRLTGSSDLYGRSGRRPCASINFITAHDGFTLHDLVSVQRQAQRGERRRQPRRHTTTISRGTAASKDRPTIRRSTRCASARSATCWRRCCCRRACRCCSPATRSAARSRATTTPTARTTRSAGSTGTSDARATATAEFATRDDRAYGANIRFSGGRDFFQGRPMHGERSQGHRLAQARRHRDD